MVDHFLEFRFLIINEKSLSETVFKLLIPFSSVATKLAKKLLPNDYKQSIYINQSYNNRSRRTDRPNRFSKTQIAICYSHHTFYQPFLCICCSLYQAIVISGYFFLYIFHSVSKRPVFYGRIWLCQISFIYSVIQITSELKPFCCAFAHSGS